MVVVPYSIIDCYNVIWQVKGGGGYEHGNKDEENGI